MRRLDFQALSSTAREILDKAIMQRSQGADDDGV